MTEQQRCDERMARLRSNPTAPWHRDEEWLAAQREYIEPRREGESLVDLQARALGAIRVMGEVETRMMTTTSD